MRRRITILLAAVLSVVTVMLLVADVRGEVSARRERDRVRTLVIGGPLTSIADDPDPVPTIIWEPLGATNGQRLPVNPSGDLRPDGLPFVAFHPLSGWPVVVWSFNNGGEHDVAISWWTGQSWSDVHYLTSSADDERHPKAAVGADGTMHVVWTVDGAQPSVSYASFTPSSIDSALGDQVSPLSEPGRRPSVAVVDGEVWIAYERGPAGAEVPVANRIVLRRRLNDGAFEGIATFDSTRAAELDVEIHAHDGFVWFDWKLSESSFGYSRLGASGWNPHRQMPWTDPSWIGEEDVRRSIRRDVLASPSTAPTDPGD